MNWLPVRACNWPMEGSALPVRQWQELGFTFFTDGRAGRRWSAGSVKQGCCGCDHPGRNLSP